MAELKSGWRRVKFGEVVRLGKERCDPASDGIERYIGLEHIEPGDLRVRSWGDVSDGTTFTTRVRPGHVLFGKRRAYQRKVAVADFDAVCSGDIYVFESANPGKLLPELLPFLCQTDAFFDYAVGTSAGSLSPRTNWTSLAEYEFVLPPLWEQQRNVRLLRATEDVLRTADYVAGCARIAFHAALEHLHAEAHARFGAVPLVAAVEAGRPITYGILMPGTGFPGGVPVVKVKDFPNGEIDEHDLLLTDPAIEHEYRRSRLRQGDLLVSIRGTIGRVAVVGQRLEGANITQDTARLSFPKGTNVAFMRAMLESASVQRKMHSNIPPPAPAGMSPAKAKPRPNIQGLNIGELRQVSVPIPTAEIQDRYAEVAEAARAAMWLSTARVKEASRLKFATIAECLRGTA